MRRWIRGITDEEDSPAAESGIPKTEEENFKHAPLRGQRDIRLLRLRRRIFSDMIRCEFIHVSLEQKSLPKYWAISYTWADPTPKHNMRSVGGQVLPLTETLNSILQHPFFKRANILLWIDALCIDQSDLTEKSHQVRMMRGIYESAVKVIVWLGEPDEDSDRAMDTFHLQGPHFRYVEELEDIPEFSRTLPGRIQNMHGMTNPAHDLSHVGRFLCRPWFERVWIIQEVVVNDKVLMVCGDRTLSWDDFSSVMLFISKHNLERLMGDQVSGNIPSGAISARFLAHLRQIRLLCLEKQYLQNMLINSNTFKATDTRDKVYALLGIVDDVGEGIIVPDYTATAEHVFTDTAKRLLTHTKALLILSAAGIGSTRPLESLPSWVPDWTSAPAAFYLHAAPYAPYAATDLRDPQIRATADPGLLAITGVTVDSVGAMGAHPPEDLWRSRIMERPLGVAAYSKDMTLYAEASRSNLDKNKKVHAYMENSKRFAESFKPYPTGETFEEVLWRSLIANVDESGRLAPSKYGDFYQSWLAMLKMPVEQPGGWTKADEDLFFQARQFAAAWNNHGKGRKLFHTSRGYLGLTSLGTCKGDIVCLFLGANVPFILRSSTPTEAGDRTYALVGECYIHGLMSGEGMEMGDLQEIILR